MGGATIVLARLVGGVLATGAALGSGEAERVVFGFGPSTHPTTIGAAREAKAQSFITHKMLERIECSLHPMRPVPCATRYFFLRRTSAFAFFCARGDFLVWPFLACAGRSLFFM